MPQYYFDLRDSTGVLIDEEGVELRDIDVARQEAARALADMAREALGGDTGQPAQHMTVEVRDNAGPVFQVKFSFEIQRTN
jgi:hypothetical protein